MRVVFLVALSVLLAHSPQLSNQRIVPLFRVEVADRSGHHFCAVLLRAIAGKFRNVSVRVGFTLGGTADAAAFPSFPVDGLLLLLAICPTSWVLPDRVALEDTGLKLILLYSDPVRTSDVAPNTLQVNLQPYVLTTSVVVVTSTTTP